MFVRKDSNHNAIVCVFDDGRIDDYSVHGANISGCSFKGGAMVVTTDDIGKKALVDLRANVLNFAWLYDSIEYEQSYDDGTLYRVSAGGKKAIIRLGNVFPLPSYSEVS